VAKSAASFAAEYGQQVLQKIGDGQSPERVARQLGRTPETIRDCLAVIGEQVARPSRRPSWLQRMTALRNEVAASLVSRSESRHVAQIADELLKLYWIVAASDPGLRRRDIYRKVVMARTGADEDEAGVLLRRAEQSFASWPKERDLTFADVVHYVAVSEYLGSDDRFSTRIDMGRLVAGRIPPEL
jgi:hypothetical protein